MNKPEWFELAEKDGGKTHFEVKRGLRSFLLAIPLLAIGAGVVFAQTSDESPATAETATTAIASASPSIATPMLPPTYADDDEDDDGDDHDNDENEEEEDDD